MIKEPAGEQFRTFLPSQLSGEKIDADRLSLSQIYQRLNTTPEAIASFCEKWQIAEFTLFGSVLRDDFRIDGEDPSDIDIMFIFVAEVNQSLMKRVRIKYELENLFNREVDLIDRQEIVNSHNWIRRGNILRSEQVIYARR